ncbi:MAG: YicC family protein [Bacteroidaceae bacterium]|nr:YicC family protein [Bacteroidaceae bacterium]
MIQSMTGYGKCPVKFGNRTFTAEIKSLNSKSMDISTRIAPLFREKELEIRSLITASLERGKCDFSLTIEENAGTASQSINEDILSGYISQIRSIADRQHIDLPSDWFQTVLRLPDVISQAPQEQLTDDAWTAAGKAVEDAIRRLMDFRTQEGKALEAKFREKISNIRELLASVGPFEKNRVEDIKKRIRESLESNIGTEYDKNRFEQELIYYIEKLDINEEKQRLSNHLDYFLETLENDHGQGKKLGFIAQEMGREINTLGSKSNQAEMQNIVVRMKDELEQIKEQVLNVM